MEKNQLFQKGFIKQALAVKKAMQEGFERGESYDEMVLKYGFHTSKTI